jgi:DNA-binding IclR family transcriptional regulator
VLFSGTVMCVDDAPAAGAPPGLFSRGQRRPLFAGAASKVILAHLPPHQLRALFERHRAAIADAALGPDWDAFRVALRTIRKAGYCITQGEFRSGIVGIAAPLFNAAGEVLGSLGIAAEASMIPAEQHGALAAMVMEAAKDACGRIARQQSASARPARSV